MADCIFCEIIAGRAEASKVYEDELCTVFMDIQPINPGHLLVVPKAHAADLADLAPEIGGHLFQVAQRIALNLPSTGIKCEGVNLVFAHREAAGQDVFHAHLHVIPRFKGDGFGFKFGPGYRDLPAREALDKIASQIRHTL